MASTTDFFSPISLDPFKQGHIAAANTLSDLYAAGVTEVHTMLMILGICLKMPEGHVRDTVAKEMVRGFIQCCKEAGTRVSGGQTVLNPWPLIGGCASAVVREEDLVRADRIEPGDILVLTKPLGTQVTGNLALWMLDEAKWSTVSQKIDAATATRAVRLAEDSMMRLNREAAVLMKEFDAHGATDITGFGLLGHARNLAGVQRADVRLVLHTLPIIRGLAALSHDAIGTGVDYRLTEGLSAETSGGLLVALKDRQAAAAFIARLSTPAWEVGHAEAGGKTAEVVDAARIVEV